MRLLLLLASVALTACSASMVIKQPVVSQCEGAGLRGCEEITDGVLAYVDGDRTTGRAKLVAGAAQNNPEQVRQFAKTLSALRDLPGMSDQMGPVGEIAAILAGDLPLDEGGSDVPPSALAAKGAPSGGDDVAAGSASAPRASRAGDRSLIAHTTSLDDDRRRACRDHASATATCVPHRGAIVVTDVVFDGACEGAFVAALPRDVLATSSARWVFRKQVAGGTWPVDADELFVVGGADGTKSEISWAARAR